MPEAALVTEEMLRVVGIESPPVTYDIEKGHIRLFAEAIGDANILYTDEAEARKTSVGSIVAPPTFFRALLPKDLPPLELPKGLLDGGSQWQYFGRVRAGDRITVTEKYVSFNHRKGRLGDMLFMVTEARYVNQFGELVATQRWTRIRY